MRDTLYSIKISADSISDFRSLSTFLIKSNFPFHTYALKEERKRKTVKQGNPVFVVHRMPCRVGTELGLVLAVLHKTDATKDIYQPPPNKGSNDTPRCPDEPNKGAFNNVRRMTGHVGHPCPPSASHAPQAPILQTKEPAVYIRSARTPPRALGV
ncbi:hypothetical protein EVAR_45455_1 [Eumeta japonica]|uniref:Uncharacterized protein n=1 Tax=Eumeta variegata TaxID=151549 RepID=A0A4C1YLN5_EUMVA|nr:hypothetical protein EVAR_45455_1 [Eumeta japonica]